MAPQARRKRIPGTQVLNWQPSETQASKPVIRRPMTACEACRSAKVKCDGQQTCERCRTRGLRCTYIPPPSTPNENRNGDSAGPLPTSVSQSSSHVISTVSSSGNQPTPDPMSMDATGDAYSNSAGYSGALPLGQTSSGMDNWAEQTFDDALKQFDWGFSDSDLGFSSNQASSHNGPGFPQSPTEEAIGISTDAANGNASTSTIDSEPPFEISQQLHSCQCRANMVMQIPRLQAAIQELPKPQLDKMFKAAGDAIQSCLQSTRCGCQTEPVDLVFTMTVFEQTAFCFNHIAKSGIDGTVRVAIGNYSMARSDDASLKRILVLDLVNQGNELLASMNALAHKMFLTYTKPGGRRMSRSPPCLNQANINYVQEASASFRRFFRMIKDSFEEKYA